MQNNELELSVISHLLTINNKNKLNQVFDQLDPEDFSTILNRQIYSCMRQLRSNDVSVIVPTYLSIDKTAKKHDVIKVLTDNINDYRHEGSIDKRIETLRILRINKLIKFSFTDLKPIKEEKDLENLSQKLNKLFMLFPNSVIEKVNYADILKEKKKRIGNELNLVFDQLNDEPNVNLYPGNIFVLGAESGCGKSTYAYEFAVRNMLDDKKVLFFSTEIKEQDIRLKLLYLWQKIMQYTLDEAIAFADGTHDDIKVFDDVYDIDSILARSRRYEMLMQGVDILIIDHLQELECDGTTSEYDRITKACTKIRQYAKNTNTCVLLLSQVKGDQDQVFHGAKKIKQVSDMSCLFDTEKHENIPVKRSLKMLKNREGIIIAPFNFQIEYPVGLISNF